MERSFNRKSKNKDRSNYARNTSSFRIGCLWMLLPLFGYVFFLGFINIRDISSYFDRNISKNFKYKKKYNEAKKNGSSVFFSSIDGPINSKVKIFYDSFNSNGLCKIINSGSFKILNNGDILMPIPKNNFLNGDEVHIFIKYRLDKGSIQLARPNIIFHLVKDIKGFPIPKGRNVNSLANGGLFFPVPFGWPHDDKKLFTKFYWDLFENSENVFVRNGIERRDEKGVIQKTRFITNEFSPKTIYQIVEHFKYCEGKMKM